MRLVLHLLATGAMLVPLLAQDSLEDGLAEEHTNNVGIEGVYKLFTRFDDLEPKEVDPDGDILLRLASKKGGEESFVYDFRYMGMTPGEYDLRDYLTRTGGGSLEDLPPMRVTVVGVLPPEHDALLNKPELMPLPWLWGYRLGLTSLAALWLAGLWWWWRTRPRPPVEEVANVAPAEPTLADYLQPLVERAARHELEATDKARLERLLIRFWKEKLDLGAATQTEALAAMRRHPQAGELLAQLDNWLHRPDPSPPENLEKLLEPYRRAKAPAELEGAA